MIQVIKEIFHQTTGKYTQELKLSPTSDPDLSHLPKRLHPNGTVKSVCGYCSTGCNLNIHMKDGVPINLTADPRYPVNLGEACPKGWEALTPLKASDRAINPYLRKDGRLEPVDWHEALTTFVDRIVEIQNKYGKDSVAFLSTGQIPTEEMAFLGALAKFGMGMIHGDGNTRQCMATAVTAYKESFGFDAPPYTYKDYEESDVLVFIGANPCIAHPIMWQRVVMNPNKPKIIVIDPRSTETAMAATHHYAIRPKTDLLLFYTLAHILTENEWIDREYIYNHTADFDSFEAFVKEFKPDVTSSQIGISIERLNELAAVIHEGKRVSFWWTMGVNQSYEGVRTTQSIINLALMTGNIGKPGTGANSITGQCNAMGSRLFSNTTNLFGGRSFLDPDDRREVASILDIPESSIPNQNSWAYDQIIEGVINGKIKGLWVIATNPAHSWINQTELKEYLGDLEFLVVQDMYHTTETAQMADLILPAAGWGEKDGTFINSERRIGRVQKVAKAPGVALADFHIFKLIAEFWGCGRMFQNWESPEHVFNLLKELSRGRPCDISGIDGYAMLEEKGGIQWPYRSDDVYEHERRLFENNQFFHKDKRAKFVFANRSDIPEEPNEDYPLALLTGRGSSSQWHTQTRTSKSPVLQKMYPQEVYVEINPRDAKSLCVLQKSWVYVSTLRGKIKARAVLMSTIRPGQIFMPMHYKEVNQLTFPAFDPYSRQPSYKMCAARVERVR